MNLFLFHFNLILFLFPLIALADNWAVIIDSSRYWFNYRHIANSLSIYSSVKRLGIPDSNIILMLADDMPCNPRNPFPGSVFNDQSKKTDLYGGDVEGYEVNVENIIRLLTGRHKPETPRSKRLLTDDSSNILLYMTGHGGNGFLKFQDNHELSSHDLADAIAQMYEKKRYNEIFFIIDTCQAASMFELINSPNVVAAASSLVGQNSYSHHADNEIGVAVIDRFTYYTLSMLENIKRGDKTTLQDLFDSYKSKPIHSTPAFRTDLFSRSMSKTLITDFFGGQQSIELTLEAYPLKYIEVEQDKSNNQSYESVYPIPVPVYEENKAVREKIERTRLTPRKYDTQFLSIISGSMILVVGFICFQYLL